MRWSRRSTKTALLFAMFSLACIALTVALAARIGNLDLFAHRTGYTALLSDASGLRGGDDVKIAGVTVGQVDSIGVNHGDAIVTFSLDDNVRVRTSTGVGLRWQDVIGDKVLYLYPGTTGAWLAPGGTLGISNDVADASVGQFLDTLSPFLQSIDPKQANELLVAFSDALQGNDATIQSVLDSSAKVSATLGGDNAEIGAVIDEYDQVASALAHHEGDISTLVSELSTVASGLRSRNSLLDSMVGNLSRVTADFGGLLQDNRSNLDGTIDQLDAVAQELERHQGQLAESLTTLPSGLAPYEEISSDGQWFNIQVVYSCLADETVCVYQNALDAPGGPSLPVPGVTGVSLPGASGPPSKYGGLPGLSSLGKSGTPSLGAGGLPGLGASGAGGLSTLFGPLAGTLSGS